MWIDKINLYAVELIEQLGNCRPTQAQIDKAESFIKMLDEKSLKSVFPENIQNSYE